MKKLIFYFLFAFITISLYAKDHKITYEVKGKGIDVVITITKSEDDFFMKNIYIFNEPYTYTFTARLEPDEELMVGLSAFCLPENIDKKFEIAIYDNGVDLLKKPYFLDQVITDSDNSITRFRFIRD